MRLHTFTLLFTNTHTYTDEQGHDDDTDYTDTEETHLLLLARLILPQLMDYLTLKFKHFFRFLALD